MNAAFAGDVFSLAERAVRHERRVDLAGVRVRLRLPAGRLLEIYEAAFGHLAAPTDAGDDLVVTVAGDAGRAPFAGPDYGDGGRTLLDFERGRVLHWVRRDESIPAWAAASPLRTQLGRFLATRGRFLLHGAAVGRPDGGVLIAAKGGSGKSTTALACLQGGLSVTGDDLVVLAPSPTAPRVCSLYGTAKIGRDQLPRFPDLDALVVRGGGPLDDPAEKAVLRLFPRIALSLPLRAIAVPSLALDRAESRIEPLSRREALLALAPSSIFLIRGAAGETLAPIAALVASLPAFRLRIGSDVRGIPRAVDDLLEQARG